MLQKVSLTLSHNVAIEFTQSGIRIGLNMLTWGFIDASRAEVERPKDVLSKRLDAPDERTICPEFHTITPAALNTPAATGDVHIWDVCVFCKYFW